MTRKEKVELASIIENEGFCYTFIDYSEFPKIKDDEFHKLREKLVEAYKELRNYISI